MLNIIIEPIICKLNALEGGENILPFDVKPMKELEPQFLKMLKLLET